MSLRSGKEDFDSRMSFPLVCHSVRGSNRSLARKNKIIRYASLLLFFCFRLSLDTLLVISVP